MEDRRPLMILQKIQEAIAGSVVRNVKCTRDYSGTVALPTYILWRGMVTGVRVMF